MRLVKRISDLSSCGSPLRRFACLSRVYRSLPMTTSAVAIRNKRILPRKIATGTNSPRKCSEETLAVENVQHITSSEGIYHVKSFLLPILRICGFVRLCGCIACCLWRWQRNRFHSEYKRYRCLQHRTDGNARGFRHEDCGTCFDPGCCYACSSGAWSE